MAKAHVLFVIGVSGCGKSTIGKLLAADIDYTFLDGDDYHPKVNVEKMSKGIPLVDKDRYEWLQLLNRLASENAHKGVIIACSALKKSYRDVLQQGLGDQVVFVYLKGSREEIAVRLRQRKGHFMPQGLLNSQIAALEPPEEAITISIKHRPREIVQKIIAYFKTQKS